MNNKIMVSVNVPNVIVPTHKLKEWLEFWIHYSNTSERFQDEMRTELDNTVLEMKHYSENTFPVTENLNDN